MNIQEPQQITDRSKTIKQIDLRMKLNLQVLTGQSFKSAKVSAAGHQNGNNNQ